MVLKLRLCQVFETIFVSIYIFDLTMAGLKIFSKSAMSSYDSRYVSRRIALCSFEETHKINQHVCYKEVGTIFMFNTHLSSISLYSSEP